MHRTQMNIEKQLISYEPDRSVSKVTACYESLPCRSRDGSVFLRVNVGSGVPPTVCLQCHGRWMVL